MVLNWPQPIPSRYHTLERYIPKPYFHLRYKSTCTFTDGDFNRVQKYMRSRYKGFDEVQIEVQIKVHINFDNSTKVQVNLTTKQTKLKRKWLVFNIVLSNIEKIRSKIS